jgi:threonine aldolase
MADNNKLHGIGRVGQARSEQGACKKQGARGGQNRLHQFTNDYSEGACPEVLDALVRTNAEQTPGYTMDEHCSRAARLILDQCGLSESEASVFFVVGGTAANVISLDGLLRRPYDAVICTPDGHINTHETGAIESVGHKALASSDADGFLSVEAADEIVRTNAAFPYHMTRPKALYISDTTELGGVYHARRVEELSEYAHGHGMTLFVDGARLGSALTAASNDLTLPQIAHLADAFTVGGTKNGLLFGEAVVARDQGLREDMLWLMKQHQNMLAKGRLLGVQFEAAFAGGALGEADESPYWRYARSANRMAARLAEGIEGLGFELATPPESNQLFVRTDAGRAEKICAALGCETFVDEGKTRVIRFVTSWATTEEHVNEAIAYLASL